MKAKRLFFALVIIVGGLPLYSQTPQTWNGKKCAVILTSPAAAVFSVATP